MALRRGRLIARFIFIVALFGFGFVGEAILLSLIH
jgi:hypothetical protein